MIGAPAGDPRRSGRRHSRRIIAGMAHRPRGPQRPLRGGVAHIHSCIRCPKMYPCTNACDPVGEGLDSSICPGCFEEVQQS